MEMKKMQIFSKDVIPKVVFMSGMGKAFCAGADVAGIYRYKQVPQGIRKLKMMMNQEYLLIYLLAKMKPIQVVHWNGTVIGGGAGLSINAPIRIATENSIFAMPEVNIGLFPDAGATWFLPRVFNNNSSIGLFAGLTGHRVKGKDLAKCGVATHFIKEENISKLKSEMVLLSENESVSVDKIKSLCDKYSEIIYSPSTFSFDGEEFINKIFKFDSLINIVKRLNESLKTESPKEVKLAKYILGVFKRVSPISLLITFEQLKRGTQIKRIEEAFAIESQLAYTFVEGHDLFEGIRSNFIEKSGKPNWEYKSIAEVDVDKLIHKYFEVKNESHIENFNFI
jgi:3-hydroxyisobutyryl-CoA hydrolase